MLLAQLGLLGSEYWPDWRILIEISSDFRRRKQVNSSFAIR